MNQIIGGRSCRSCSHRRIAGQEFFCYRYPPVPLAVPMVDPRTKQPCVGFQSVYPSVNPDMPCGEYSRSEAFAAEEVLGRVEVETRQ
jgi:hypothetical protein